MQGSQIIYKKLIQHNVKNVFLYSGGAVMSIIDQFYNNKHINYYINSNEQNGCNSAVGYAKSSNKTGVMITTSGPGLTNCITSMLDSTNDSTPLIVISGQVSLNAIGTNAFQESPAVDITKNVTKWSYLVDNIDDLPYIMDYAFYIANDGKKGAVHLDIPKCITMENSSNHDIKKMYLNNNIIYKKSSNISNEYLSKIYHKINTSKKPIFIIGQGANNYQPEIKKLIEKTNIPVTTTMHAMGIYDERKKLSLKMCGMHGSYYANKAIQNSDCIINIGGRFDDRTIGNISKFAPIATKKKNIIHCNISDIDINKTIHSYYPVISDANFFITKLINNINYKKRKNWIKQIDYWKELHPFQYYYENLDIKTQSVLSYINNIIKCKKKYIFTFGVGNHLMMGCQFIDWQYPKKILASGSLGAMGSSIGYSIGAQIANPDKTIICIDGDGSFNMNLSDLQTIKRYNLPIKIAIMNDSCLSMVKTWEKLFYNERYTATDNPDNPDYVKIAESYNIKGISCDNIENLTETINYFINYNEGPILCDFRVKSDVCLPLVRPGASLDDMILFKDYNKDMQLDKKNTPC